MPQKATKSNKAKPAKKTERYDPSVPKPTLAGVRYGEHERHFLEFWRAGSDSPTPLVFIIHGGGWLGGDCLAVMGVVAEALVVAQIPPNDFDGDACDTN